MGIIDIILQIIFPIDFYIVITEEQNEYIDRLCFPENYTKESTELFMNNYLKKNLTSKENI